MAKIQESGSLWDGRAYDIYADRGHYTLTINDAFYSSGDTLEEIYDELEELAQVHRHKKLQSM